MHDNQFAEELEGVYVDTVRPSRFKNEEELKDFAVQLGLIHDSGFQKSMNEYYQDEDF